jgi:hypothetical protein
MIFFLLNQIRTVLKNMDGCTQTDGTDRSIDENEVKIRLFKFKIRLEKVTLSLIHTKSLSSRLNFCSERKTNMIFIWKIGKIGTDGSIVLIFLHGTVSDSAEQTFSVFKSNLFFYHFGLMKQI